MGRFGGRELSYASDLDVLFVYDGTTAADFARAERTAEASLRASSAARHRPSASTTSTPTCGPRASGPARPEPRRLPHATSSAGPRPGSARRWCGPGPSPATPTLGRRFVRRRVETRVGPAAHDDERREIRRMKARIERERHPGRRGPAVPPEARAGLAVRRRVHRAAAAAAATTSARPAPSTALDALAAGGRTSTPTTADVLGDAYAFCERTRQPVVPRQRRAGRLAAQPARAARPGSARSLDTHARPSCATSYRPRHPAGPAGGASVSSTGQSGT